MRNYKRKREGSMFFFTVVTHQRRSFLTSPLTRQCLRQAIQQVRRNHRYGLVESMIDYPWSSFHRDVKLGHYPPNWGYTNEWHGD